MSCFDSAAAIPIEPAPGWIGRAVHGAHMTLVEYRISEGAPDVHEHHHPEEEAWTVLHGELKIWLEDTPHALTAGQALVIGPDTRHRVQAITATHAIVIDSPARHDLPGTKPEPAETSRRPGHPAAACVHAKRGVVSRETRASGFT